MVLIRISLIEDAANKEVTEPRVPLRKFYGLDFVDRYGISVSQMTTDMS